MPRVEEQAGEHLAIPGRQLVLQELPHGPGVGEQRSARKPGLGLAFAQGQGRLEQGDAGRTKAAHRLQPGGRCLQEPAQTAECIEQRAPLQAAIDQRHRSWWQEILRLYDFPGTVDAARQIEGIMGLSSERKFSRVISENGITYVRGVRVDMELDEEQFVGGGVYLFASILEQFLGHYVTLNSFSQLRVRTRQRKEVLREWAPRAGHRILL